MPLARASAAPTVIPCDRPSPDPQDRRVHHVFLLDDHEIVRRGIGQLLETQGDIEVVGEAGTAAQPLARIPALRPDVAVLDVRLPDGDGVSVCRDILTSVEPPPACLMLTSYSDDEALLPRYLRRPVAPCRTGTRPSGTAVAAGQISARTGPRPSRWVGPIGE